MLGGLLALAVMCTLLFASPAAALPPGPIPVIHVDSWYCTGYQTSNCGSIDINPSVQHQLWYTYYGNVSGGVTCTDTPYGYPANIHHFEFIYSQVTWTVSCTDSSGEGFSKTVTIRPQPGIRPPGPVPYLHAGAWNCYDWSILDCGTIRVARGTDMYFTVYGTISNGGYSCTDSSGHGPNVHWVYGGQTFTWDVVCTDNYTGEGFEKYVRVQPA